MYCTFAQSMFTPIEEKPSLDPASVGLLRMRHLFLLRLIWRLKGDQPLLALSARGSAESSVTVHEVRNALDLSLKEAEGDHWQLESRWRAGGSLHVLDTFQALLDYYRVQIAREAYVPLIVLCGGQAEAVVACVNAEPARGRTARLLKEGSCLLTASLAVQKPWHDHVEWLCRDEAALASVQEADRLACHEISDFNQKLQTSSEDLVLLLQAP